MNSVDLNEDDDSNGSDTGKSDLKEHVGNEMGPRAEAHAVAGRSPFRVTTVPQPAETHGGVAGISVLAPMEKERLDFPEEFDENFPDDLGKCYQILRDVDSLPLYFRSKNSRFASKETRRRRDEQARRRKLIGSHIMKLSGYSLPVHIDADSIAKMQQAQRDRPQTFNERKAVLLDFLKTPIDKDIGTCEPDLTDTNDYLYMEPKGRLLMDKKVQEWLLLARLHACHAELFSIQNWDLINPAEYVAHLKNELRSCADPIRARELQAKISTSQQSSENNAEFPWRNHKSVAITKGQVEEKWRPTIEALNATFELCKMRLMEWRMTAILAEADFFELCGMGWKQTEVSKRYADLISEIEKLTVTKGSFAWFDVPDYAVSESENE